MHPLRLFVFEQVTKGKSATYLFTPATGRAPQRESSRRANSWACSVTTTSPSAYSAKPAQMSTMLL